MDVAAAAAVLGVSVDADWREVRQRHRVAIAAAHPDRPGGDGRRAAEVNAALEVLRGRPAPPSGEDMTAALADDDVFGRLAKAATELGEVDTADRAAGTIVVRLTGADSVGQLVAQVGSTNENETPVSFSLDPIGTSTPPAIADVVQSLMRHAGW